MSSLLLQAGQHVRRRLRGIGIGCVRREEVTEAMVMGWPLEAANCGEGDEDAGM